MRQMLGHDGPPTNYWTENLVTGERLGLCPLRSIILAAEHSPALAGEVERHVDAYYPAYKDGHLLEPGGVASQPARYMAYMRAIAATELVVQDRFDEINRKNDGGDVPSAEGWQ